MEFERWSQSGRRPGRDPGRASIGFRSVTAETVTPSRTNAIDECLSTVQQVTRNVKGWREGNQPLRWSRQLQALDANHRFSLGGPDPEVTRSYLKMNSSEDLGTATRG
jgi:hypothetical protein